MFRKSVMMLAATAAIGAAVALAPAIASARGGGGHGGGGHGGGGHGGGGHGGGHGGGGHGGNGGRGGGGGRLGWVGAAGRGRSPSMVAASFTAHASTAVFAALPSPAAPPTPTATITATIAVGSGIPPATATCEFGSVDRQPGADEKRRPSTGRSTRSRSPHQARRRRSAARQIPRTGISRSAGNRIRSDANSSEARITRPNLPASFSRRAAR